MVGLPGAGKAVNEERRWLEPLEEVEPTKATDSGRRRGDVESGT